MTAAFLDTVGLVAVWNHKVPDPFCQTLLSEPLSRSHEQ